VADRYTDRTSPRHLLVNKEDTKYNVEAAIEETCKSIETVLEGHVGGDTVSKDRPIVIVNLIPAFEADLAPFSVLSCLSRELL
jgi:hypothetical protein